MDASEAAVADDEARGEYSTWDSQRMTRRPPDANAILARARAGESALTPPDASEILARARVGGRRTRPQSAAAWAGPASAYIRVEPLDVSCRREQIWQRRVGASRPTRVPPRPQSAQVMMHAARQTPAYAAEIDRITVLRLNAATQSRAKHVRSTLIG